MYFKVLRYDGVTEYTLTRWHLPRLDRQHFQWKPGLAMPQIRGKIAECRNGYHLADETNLSMWAKSGNMLFVAEGTGEAYPTEGGTKTMFRKARLIEPVGLVDGLWLLQVAGMMIREGMIAGGEKRYAKHPDAWEALTRMVEMAESGTLDMDKVKLHYKGGRGVIINGIYDPEANAIIGALDSLYMVFSDCHEIRYMFSIDGINHAAAGLAIGRLRSNGNLDEYDAMLRKMRHVSSLKLLSRWMDPRDIT